MMAAAREDGTGRARRHDAVPRRASARWPGSCRRGSPRTAPEAAVARAPRPGARGSGCATSATATGASSTRANGTACGCRRAQQHPELGRPQLPRRSPTLAQGTRGTATSTSSPTPARDYESDPRRRDALHRRAPGGDDLATRSSASASTRSPSRTGPLSDDPDASARLRRPRPLPHPPRAREGHAAPRGGDPEDDEHAGGALRPLGSRPPARGLRADVVVFDYDELDDVSTIENPHRVRTRASSTCSSTASSSSTAASTPAPGRAGTCCDGDAALIDLRSDSARSRRTRCGRRCGRAELGWATIGEDPSVNELQERVAALLGKEAATLGADLRDGQPGRPADDRRRGAAPSSSKPPRTSSPPRRWGSRRSRGLEPWSLWAADGRLDPTEVEERSSRPARGAARAREHAHAGGRHRPLARADGRRSPRRRQRHGAVRPLDGARLFNAAVALGVPLPELAAR